eukprot:4470688-Heterocapsa_arctica.AAC.1
MHVAFVSWCASLRAAFDPAVDSLRAAYGSAMAGPHLPCRGWRAVAAMPDARRRHRCGLHAAAWAWRCVNLVAYFTRKLVTAD